MSRNFLSKPPIERHGVSTEEKPLPKIPVNTAYELDQETLDDFHDSLSMNSCAPSPYQLSIFDNHIDIYSGDGRIIATIMRDNFTNYREYIFTARMMAYSYCWYDVARYALGYVEMLRAGRASSYPEKYDEKSETFYSTSRALMYGGFSGSNSIYEPVRYESKGYEHETEKAYEDEPRVPRSIVTNDASGEKIILFQDHELPELNEDAYENGYA